MGLGKLSVGQFQPRDANAPVNNIRLRAARLGTPEGNFAGYLETAIRSDLTDMGLYDAASPIRLDALILNNTIDISGFSTGYGAIEVKFSLSRNGTVSLEKIYRADIQFESSLLGRVAIPKGQTEYPRLVRTLLQNVYSDPAFAEGTRK